MPRSRACGPVFWHAGFAFRCHNHVGLHHWIFRGSIPRPARPLSTLRAHGRPSLLTSAQDSLPPGDLLPWAARTFTSGCSPDFWSLLPPLSGQAYPGAL